MCVLKAELYSGGRGGSGSGGVGDGDINRDL